MLQYQFEMEANSGKIVCKQYVTIKYNAELAKFILYSELKMNATTNFLTIIHIFLLFQQD